MLELDFINGFAPHAGDTFDLVTYGSVTGNFSNIDIEGLELGFQYNLAPDGNGNLQLTALNDGVPITSINISGTISYCSNPLLGPVPNVTLTLTGTSTGSTTSAGSGNYAFSSLPSGGSYTVTPTKAARTPGSSGISTVDVIAVQRHFLNLGTPLSGCKLTAADCASPFGTINTTDVIAIQRFFLGLTTGIGNVGKYSFTPVNRSYTNLVADQTGQNYDTIVFGDVASPFANP